MKQRNLNLVFLRPSFVVPFQQNAIGAIENFNDGAHKVAGCSGDPLTGFKGCHATTVKAPEPAQQNLGGEL